MDTETFLELYRTHYDGLVGYLFLRTKDRNIAEDLAQQTFLNAWVKRDTYDGRGKDKGYLYSIAHNLAIDVARRNTIVEFTVMDDIDEEPHAQDELEEVEREEIRQEVRHAVRQLKDLQRGVIERRFFYEDEHKTIAEELGKTEGAVRIIQLRALQRLAKNLSHLGEVKRKLCYRWMGG